MRAGPKASRDASPLPFQSEASGAARFHDFCRQYVTIPKGHNALRPMRLRPWELALVGSVLNPLPRPRLAGWMLPRGQGKTTKMAALGLYEVMTGQEGASVPIVATDERQAAITYNIARRMVELHPALEARVQIFQDRLYVPARDAHLQVLPAVAKRVEGLDPTFGIVDEAGRVDREVWEVLLLASGKRAESTVVAIGTPPPRVAGDAPSVLESLRQYAREHPDDKSVAWVEHSAAGYEDHAVDCEHCLTLANPALGDFLARDAAEALLPPKTRESTYRRARLCQFVDEVAEPWITAEQLEPVLVDEQIPDGAEVVLTLDGSFNGDCTAILAATVGDRPHLQVVECWEPPTERGTGYQVPVADVEQAIRDACRRWQVHVIAADPFRWVRSLQALEAESLPILEFPQSPARMSPATAGFYEAVTNERVTITRDARLLRHLANAVLKVDARGSRIVKEHRHSKRRIDLAVCAIMGYAEATSVEEGPQIYAIMLDAA